MEQLNSYVSKLMSGLKPFLGSLLALINYILFPDTAFQTALYAVVGAMILDIITKWYAISKQNDGFKNSIKSRKIYSKTLWEGTKIKIISYLVISILAGLSYRVIMFKSASIFLATVIYSIMFLREAQSIIENLIDAGSDLEWLLIFVKKKQEQILEQEMNKIEINKNEGDYNDKV